MRQSVMKKNNVPRISTAFRGSLLLERIMVFFIRVSLVPSILRQMMIIEDAVALWIDGESASVRGARHL